MTPVTFVPITALIAALPELVPELVIEPALLTVVPDNVIPEAVVLLFFKTRFPLPLTPPVSENKAVLLFVKVVPLELTASGPLIVSAEVALFSVMAVTDESTFELIVVVPVPAPIFVTVPVLLISAVESVIVPPVALLLIVRLFVPVTPPLKVVEIFVPVLPIVNVPVVVDARTIGFAYVNPVVPINRVAALLPPALFPNVIVLVLAPKASAATDVPVTVPARIVVPLVYVFAPESVNPELTLFCVIPVIPVPIDELISELPVPFPEFVIVPVLSTAPVDSVIPLAIALLLLSIRLPVVLATPPDKVSNAIPLALLFISVVAVVFGVSKPLIVSGDFVLFSVMLEIPVSTFELISVLPVPVPEFVMVPMLFTSFVEIVIPLTMELLLLSIKLPVVFATPPDNVNTAVPLALLFVNVVLALLVSTPVIVRGDFVLFSMMPVTLESTFALISELAVLVPEFVIVPMLFTSLVEIVIPFAIPLLLSRIRLPAVFATPPVNVSNAVPLALVFINVVEVAFAVSRPLTVNADFVLFSVMPVTLLPTPALIRELPVLVPEFVIMPELFTAVVDNVMPEVVVLLFFKVSCLSR